MPHTGPNAGIRYAWAFEEDGWDAEQNDDNLNIDTFLHPAVNTRGSNTPPGSPSDGDRHIVGTSPVAGAWFGKANQVAAYDGVSAGYKFYPPKVGWTVFVRSEGRVYRYNGTSWNPASKVYATDFPTIQAAIDSLAGVKGTVKIPAGTYNSGTVPAYTGIVVPQNVKIEGEGVENTVLDMTGLSTSLHAVEIQSDFARISKLSINGQGSSGSGRGIYVNPQTQSRADIWLEEVVVRNSPAEALYWGGNSSIYTIRSGARRCRFHLNKSSSSVYIGSGHTTLEFHNCTFDGEGFGGAGLIKIEGCDTVRFFGGLIEPYSTDCPGVEVLFKAAATWTLNVEFHGTWFEQHLSTDSAYWHIHVGIAVANVIARGAFFNRSAGVLNLKPQVLKLIGTGSSAKPKGITLDGCLIWENRTGSVPTNDITSDDAANELNVINCRVWNANNGNVRPLEIGGTRPSMTFEMGNGQRFAFPPLTTTQRDALTLCPGLTVFNATVGKQQTYDGTTWNNHW